MLYPARLVIIAFIALATLACGPTGAAGRSAPAVATARPAPAGATTQPQAAAQPTVPAQPQAALTQPGQPAKVRAGGLGGVTDRPYFVGEGKGFYAEQGIELEVETFRSGAEMLPLLATGRLEVGQGATSPGFYNALIAGVPVKIVTDVTILKAPGPGVKNGLQLMLRKDLEGQVRSVSDLRGHKVGIISLGTLNHVQMSKVLATGGVALEEVEFAEISFPDMMAALANGAVDAGLTVEPFVTQAESRNIAVRFFDVGIATPNEPAQQLFYGPDFIRAQPDVARRFMIAYMKALRYMEDAFFKGINRDEVIQLFIQNTTMKDPALYERMGYSYSETNGGINLETMNGDEDFYVKYGYQKEKIDPRAIIDTSFSEYALQQLGRYE